MSTLNKEGTFDRRGFVKGSMAAAAIMGLGHIGGLLSYGERRVRSRSRSLVRDGLG